MLTVTTKVTAFIFDSRTDVLEKVAQVLRQKIFRPRGKLNHQSSASDRMLYHLSYRGQMFTKRFGILALAHLSKVSYVSLSQLTFQLIPSFIMFMIMFYYLRQLWDNIFAIASLFTKIFSMILGNCEHRDIVWSSVPNTMEQMYQMKFSRYVGDDKKTNRFIIWIQVFLHFLNCLVQAVSHLPGLFRAPQSRHWRMFVFSECFF